jgi:hypothetical protein
MLEHKTDEIVIDSKGFWQWCIMLRIIDFWTLSIVWYSKKLDNTSWLRLCLAKGPKRVGIPPPCSPEDGNRSSFQNVVFPSSVRIPGNRQSPKTQQFWPDTVRCFCCLHFWCIYLFSLFLFVSAAFVCHVLTGTRCRDQQMVQLLDLHTAVYSTSSGISKGTNYSHLQGRMIHFYPENRRTIFLCNNGTDLPEYNTMSSPTRQQSSLLRKSWISLLDSLMMI